MLEASMGMFPCGPETKGRTETFHSIPCFNDKRIMLLSDQDDELVMSSECGTTQPTRAAMVPCAVRGTPLLPRLKEESMQDVAARTHADQAHLLHPLHHPSAHQQPRIWVEGHGAILRDAEGREYLDGLSGLWNVNVGHGRRELAQAALEQMTTLAYSSSYAGSSNLPAIALAERLSALLYPAINTFFFTSGGAEATENAFKTASFYWKTQGKPDKVKIISRMKGYHGVTLAAMSATGLPAFWPMFEPRVPNFLQIESPYPYRFVSDDPTVSRGVAAANLLEQAI